MEYNNTLLKKYKSTFDTYHGDALMLFGILPKSYLQSGYSDMEIDYLIGEFNQNKYFKNVWDMLFLPPDQFKDEIYSNLSSFVLKEQKIYYCILLLEFLKTLEDSKSLFMDLEQIILKSIQRIEVSWNGKVWMKLVTNRGGFPYKTKSHPFTHPLLEWQMIFNELISTINGLAFWVVPVLIPYLEKDNELLMKTQSELLTFLPAHAKVFSIESPQTNHQEQTEPGAKGQWKYLPPKILLLEKLGFFQLPEVMKLSFESKGKLISTLCGGSADNAVDYIRHCDPERTALEHNPYRNLKNVKAVEDLLNQLNKGL